MGNTCKNIAVEDEEIETGTGIYSFKKAVRAFILIFR